MVVETKLDRSTPHVLSEIDFKFNLTRTDTCSVVFSPFCSRRVHTGWFPETFSGASRLGRPGPDGTTGKSSGDTIEHLFRQIPICCQTQGQQKDTAESITGGEGCKRKCRVRGDSKISRF